MCHWQEGRAPHALALLERLWHTDRLDAQAFRRLLAALPRALDTINAALERQADAPDPAPAQAVFWATIRQLVDAALWELLGDFRPETLPVLDRIQFLRGGQYLLRLGEELARQNITSLPNHHPTDARVNTLRHLLHALARRDDERAQLIPLLRALGEPTLLAMLPHARPYEAEICAALGWAASPALVALLHRLEAGNPKYSTDPTAGVVRQHAIMAMCSALTDAPTRRLLDAFAATHPSAVMLVRAALGWNRADVRRLFGRRNLLAAHALALLPLERPEELLQRYAQLTRYAQDSNSSPAGRKAYERAAARAGLTNLALQAGYADATRLEWALDDQLGTERVRLGRTWQIEGYTLTLALRDGRPVIEVRSPARLLKRTPVAVSRDYAYREVRATLEQAHNQQRRYRQVLLESMTRGQPIVPEELALLQRNSLATALLERLVLIDEAGAVGLLCAEDGALEGRHGERVRITGAVTIAHPYTLARLHWLCI